MPDRRFGEAAFLSVFVSTKIVAATVIGMDTIANVALLVTATSVRWRVRTFVAQMLRSYPREIVTATHHTTNTLK
nr:MAG TPA: hypothetical protein [Caudoviricetes sp.]